MRGGKHPKMMLVGRPAATALGLLLAVSHSFIAVRVDALNPLEIKGYKFFDSVTRDEVLIRGIDYYPRPNHGDLNHNSLDLFTYEHRHIWQRDIPFLKELGVNAIRIYAVDPLGDHDAFMCAMEEAGIYVVVALAHDCPTCAVTRDEAPDCYPPELKLQGQRVINAFARYDNTLGFSAGNEVNHFAPPNDPEWNAPCQKKFLGDMREYVAGCRSLRNVPIGLISADNQRDRLARYYNCRENKDDEYQSAEWYGLNSYVFCDGTVDKYGDALGFKSLVRDVDALNYSIPFLLTEFGCLSETFPTVDGYSGQRSFLQGEWLATEPALRDLFAGGFAFEYSIEMENAKSASPYPFTTFGLQNYGIGYFEPENCDDLNNTCTYHPFPEFDKLKKVYETANNVTLLQIDKFEVPPWRQGRSACPEGFPRLDSFDWEVDRIPSVQCPNAGPASRHVCTRAASGSVATEIAHEMVSNGLLAIVAAAATVIVVLLIYLVLKVKRSDIPVTVLTFPMKRTPGDISSDGSFSDESAGLMSMKRYRDGSGSFGPDYQAISTDSSEQDLEYLSR